MSLLCSKYTEIFLLQNESMICYKTWQLFYYKMSRFYYKTLQVLQIESFITKRGTTCEVAGIGVMKGVKVALCDVECGNFLTNAIKILGICFSYNKKLENEKSFLDHITNLQQVINIWKMRNSKLSGKKTIFKT